MVRHRLIAFALLAACGSAGCSKPTEIVVRLVASDPQPPWLLVKLHRMVPFNDNPATTPAWVIAALNGADLDLTVQPQGRETVISLLPPPQGGSDLRITVSAPGWAVTPAAPQDFTFLEDQSQEVRFQVDAPPPDGGVPDAAPRDLALPRSDGGPMDLASPMDLAHRG